MFTRSRNKREYSWDTIAEAVRTSYTRVIGFDKTLMPPDPLIFVYNEFIRNYYDTPRHLSNFISARLNHKRYMLSNFRDCNISFSFVEANTEAFIIACLTNKMFIIINSQLGSHLLSTY